MLAFVLVVSLLGWLSGEYFYNGSGAIFVGWALIFSGLSSFVGYYYSDKIVLAISGAKEINEAENKYLYNLVENLCIGAGLPKPKIYTIEDTAMNAFATGRDPKHAVVCFTTGIVDRLAKTELEGVIAHELSHIGNYDIRLLSLVSVLVGTVVLLSDWISRGVFYGRRRRSNSESGGILLIVGLFFVIISPIIAVLIKLAVSRKREFLADADAALLTRYPQGLAEALRKISQDGEVLEAANGGMAHLYIVNPLKGEDLGGFLSNIFSTHPPIGERINRLLKM